MFLYKILKIFSRILYKKQSEGNYIGVGIFILKSALSIKDEDGEYLPFDDGCNIMYVNGDYRGDDPLGKLMHDFSEPMPTNVPPKLYNW